MSLKGESCKLSRVRCILSMLNPPAAPGHAGVVQPEGPGVPPRNIGAFLAGLALALLQLDEG